MGGSADKAVLRLALGLGLAVFVAYGCALPMPFLVCLMSILVLCKPGPPQPLIKGIIVAVVFAAPPDDQLSFCATIAPVLSNRVTEGSATAVLTPNA